MTDPGDEAYAMKSDFSRLNAIQKFKEKQISIYSVIVFRIRTSYAFDRQTNVQTDASIYGNAACTIYGKHRMKHPHAG